MGEGDHWLDYYSSPGATTPSVPASPEVAIPPMSRPTPHSVQSTPRRTPWAPWSLGVALVAVIFEYAVYTAELRSCLRPYVIGATGTNEELPDVCRDSGPVWLQGRLLASWWEGAALLLIVLAVAAGVRSLIPIGRGAARGLGFTASGFFVSSAALMIGQAMVVALLGVTASLAVLGIYSGARGSEGAVATNPDFVPGRDFPADPAAARQRARMPAKRMAILTFVGAVLGPALSFVLFGRGREGMPLFVVTFGGALIWLPMFIVSYVFAIVALRRTRATGEAGRGWAISAIVVSAGCLVAEAWLIFLLWLLSQVEWA